MVASAIVKTRLDGDVPHHASMVVETVSHLDVVALSIGGQTATSPSPRSR